MSHPLWVPTQGLQASGKQVAKGSPSMSRAVPSLRLRATTTHSLLQACFVFPRALYFPNKSALISIQNDTNFEPNPHSANKFQNYSRKFHNVFLLGGKERKNFNIPTIQCFSLISRNALNCLISSWFSIKVHFPFVLEKPEES